ncbi:unnamed protein product, partial [Symbiodinium sp. KB8]
MGSPLLCNKGNVHRDGLHRCCANGCCHDRRLHRRTRRPSELCQRHLRLHDRHRGHRGYLSRFGHGLCRRSYDL